MSSAAVQNIGALYSDEHGWLRAVLYRRTGCSQTAADLTQDVFLRLLLKDNLPEIREPRAYLARMAHGLLVDQHRRRAIEKAWLETLKAVDETVPSPEEQALIIEALARIDILLEGLKPRVRTVFLMSRLDGRTYPDIAHELSVSLSTVEKDMAVALRHCYRVMLD